jgi:hypothetical protein
MLKRDELYNNDAEDEFKGMLKNQYHAIYKKKNIQILK